MPDTRVALIRQIASKRWPAVKAAVLWLGKEGWDRTRRNLTPQERQEFLALARKMKARPDNLTAKEKARLRELALQALRGPAGSAGSARRPRKKPR